VWNQYFDCKVHDLKSFAKIQCWDAGANKDTLIGETNVQVENYVKDGKTHDETIELFFEGKSVGNVFIKSTFILDDREEVEEALKKQIKEKIEEIENKSRELDAINSKLAERQQELARMQTERDDIHSQLAQEK
jgi:DNA repair exonuclease SbcCD ATPase subunit